jgi:hypothetical protein
MWSRKTTFFFDSTNNMKVTSIINPDSRCKGQLQNNLEDLKRNWTQISCSAHGLIELNAEQSHKTKKQQSR